MDSDKKESAYVTLVSSDGFFFVISREAALVSRTLRGMLGAGSTQFASSIALVLTNSHVGGFVESTSNRVKLPNISGVLLEKVCEYLYFNVKYKDKTGVPQFEIPPEMALELLVVADFLDSKWRLNPFVQ